LGKAGAAPATVSGEPLPMECHWRVLRWEDRQRRWPV